MPFEPQRTLVFMHVAKSSGTSLNAGLIDTLSPRRAVGGFDRVMFGGFSDFSSLSDEARASVFERPSDLPDGDFVHGHFSLGTTLERYADAQFMTVLREPCSRLLSHHRYWRSRTPRMLQGWGRWSRVIERSHQNLEIFLSDPLVACQTDNMTLRMLLWPHKLIPDQGFIDPRDDAALLEAARARLARFDWVDVMEDDHLADHLRSWLQRPFRYRHLNEAAGRPARGSSRLDKDLSDRAFDLLMRRSRLDLCLWQDVVRARMPGTDPVMLRTKAMIRTVARHGGAHPGGRSGFAGGGLRLPQFPRPAMGGRALARRLLDMLPVGGLRSA